MGLAEPGVVAWANIAIVTVLGTAPGGALAMGSQKSNPGWLLGLDARNVAHCAMFRCI